MRSCTCVLCAQLVAIFITLLRRTLATAVVAGAGAHLLLCQPAAPQVRFFAADLITGLLVIGAYLKRSLTQTGTATIPNECVLVGLLMLATAIDTCHTIAPASRSRGALTWP